MRDHLFISYATEDGVLAKWLARKLALMGYAVWMDQLQMLGGEKWPREIEQAIRDRSFCMLHLLSKHSLVKHNPMGERVLAIQLARERQNQDFFIPLNVDGCDPDWMTAPFNFIPFMNGWADGLKRLSAKLQKVSAPRALQGGRDLVTKSLPIGNELLSDRGEILISNVIAVEKVVGQISTFDVVQRVHAVNGGSIGDCWPHYEVGARKVLALRPPPPAWSDSYRMTGEGHAVTSDSIYGVSGRTILVNLLIQTMGIRLLSRGWRRHAKRRDHYYLCAADGNGNWLSFTDARGIHRRTKIVRHATFRSGAKPPEMITHHISAEIALARGLGRSALWVRVRPSVVLFDSSGRQITDARVGPRRRRITKRWYNQEWLNRLLATGPFLWTPPHGSDDGVALAQGYYLLQSPVEILESALELVETAEVAEAADEVYTLSPDDEKDMGNDG